MENNLTGETKTQGKFRLSIGTSLAIETLFGINDLVPASHPLPYTKYDYIFVNVRTLVRNLYGAVQKELKTTWNRDQYLREIVEELTILPEIINDNSKGKLSLVYYVDSYRRLSRIYPNAILKQSKAVGQQLYDAVETFVIADILKSAKNGNMNIMVGDCNLQLPPKERSLILTHQVVDLIPYVGNSNVHLLESHTGAIKDYTRWYTKLNGKELQRIPFNRFTIQVFGDGRHFAGLSSKYKKALLAFADVKRWNQTTTEKVIRYQLGSMQDKEVLGTLKTLF